MIIDGRSAASAAPLDYDVAIVGGGPSGLTLANELEGTGLRIAVLESGGREFDVDTQALYEGEVTGLDVVDLDTIRLRFLGGSSNHWGGYCLPLDPIDFDRAPLSGMTGWPFSRNDLAGAYERAHSYCDLGAFDYSLESVQGVGADDLLLVGDETVETAALRLSSPPTKFGEKFFDPLDASETVHLWLWSNVAGLSLSAEGTVEAIEVRTLSGETHRMTAQIVVLACGAIENARLMMIANARNGTSFGDSGGLLGACYMDHVAGGAAFLWPREPLGNTAYWSRDLRMADGTPGELVWTLRDEVLAREGLANAQFYLLPFSSDDAARERGTEARRGIAAAKSIVKWVLGREDHRFSFSQGYCTAIESADAVIAEAVLPKQATVDRILLRYEAEQQPARASRVTLMQERTLWACRARICTGRLSNSTRRA